MRRGEFVTYEVLFCLVITQGRNWKFMNTNYNLEAPENKLGLLVCGWYLHRRRNVL